MVEIISPLFVLLTESGGARWGGAGGNNVMYVQTASAFLFLSYFLVLGKIFSQKLFQSYPPDIIYKVDRGILFSFIYLCFILL